MPFAEITLAPGVNVETSPADNPAGVQESNFIRWRANLPEKRGGCTLYIDSAVNGIPSALKPWASFQGENYLGIATQYQVYTYNSTTETLRDVSPQYYDSPLAQPIFTTASGTNTISITDTTAPDLTSFDSVQFKTPVAIGGLILNGTYQITSVASPGVYTIEVGYPATSTIVGGLGFLPKFQTITGSSTITVNFPTQYQFNSLVAGNRFGIQVPVTVGGLTLEGEYVVTRILQADFFEFNANNSATSSQTVDMNNNFASLRYWKAAPPGPPLAMPFSVSTGNFNYYQSINWWLDSVQSTLVACAEDGPIFVFSPIGGYQNLTILTNAPPYSEGAFVAMPSGQIMAWGTSDNLNPVQNPLYIRWSDSKNINNWTIGGQSQAGFYTIPTGSKIVRGIQAQNQQFWFTDIDVYSAQYTGYPDFFGFLKIGAGCGLIAPRAVGIVNNSVYWMSQEQFFMCQGGSAPTPIACSVWDFIFQNSNQVNLANTICGANSLFNEIVWYFPTNDAISGIPDAYVCYNTLYNVWDYGYLSRTAWTDQSVLGFPIASDANGWIYQHETSPDLAVGQTTEPINSSLTTGYASIANGGDLIFVDWLLPDMKWGEYSQPDTATVNFTFRVTDYAGQTPKVYGPYSSTKNTPFICPRFRGRFMSVEISSNDLGSFWRLGSIRYRFAPAGSR